MKKQVLFVAALSLSLGAISQITVTSADFGSIGDQVFIGVDASPSVNIGAPGTNLVWDFTGLNTQSLDTLKFIDPSTTQFGADFPNANLATESSEGVIYFNNQASALFIEGFAFNAQMLSAGVQYNPAQSLLQFPANYNDTYSTSVVGRGKEYVGFDIGSVLVTCPGIIDSVQLVRRSSLSVNFDAWGSLRTPVDTVNALRATSHEEIVDSIFIYASNPINCIFPPINIPAGWSLAPDALAQFIGLSGAVVVDTIDLVTWYANGKDFAVCAIELSAPGGTPVEAKFQSEASQIGLSTPQHDLVDAVKIFPNPTNDVVNFVLPEGLKEGRVSVVDIAGRKVLDASLQNNRISVNSLVNGMYFYQLLNEKGELISQGKFEVKK